MTNDQYDSFEAVKARLDEIVAAVSDDSMPLDDALVLYEEAVSLGLRASDLLEANIEQRHEEEDAQEDAAQDNAAEQAVDETNSKEEATLEADVASLDVVYDNTNGCPVDEPGGE